MKTKILGDVAIISSGITYADLEKVYKYSPDSMVLKDDNGEEVFKIGIGEHDSVSTIGVVFSKNNNEAIAKINLPPNFDGDKKEYIKEEYGLIINYINIVLNKIKSALEYVDNIINAIDDKIEVLD